MECSICRTSKPDKKVLIHADCGHASHHACLPKDVASINYDLCNICATGGGEAVAAAIPLVCSSAEPRKKDGRNRLNERKGTVASILGWIDPRAGKEERKILANREPMHVIFTKHKMGLVHFLDAGIVAQDFLNNQYGWESAFAHFEDIRADPETRNKAFQRLGLDAASFRDYPNLLSLPRVLADLKIDKAQKAPFVRDVLRLGFKDGRCLTYKTSDKDWDIHTCLQLGLDADDLFGMGMRYVEQLEDLFPSNVTDAEKKHLLKQLGVNQGHIDRLLVYETPVAETPVMQEQDEESSSSSSSSFESEEEEPEPKPVLKKKEQKRPATSTTRMMVKTSMPVTSRRDSDDSISPVFTPPPSSVSSPAFKAREEEEADFVIPQPVAVSNAVPVAAPRQQQEPYISPEEQEWLRKALARHELHKKTARK